MNPNFNGPQGGGFDPNGPLPTRGGGAPVFHRMMTGEHVIAFIIFMVLVTLLLALLFFLLYRLLRKSPGGLGGHSPALRELEMRYARGEIGHDEFLQRRAHLVAPAGPPNLPPPSPPVGGAPQPRSGGLPPATPPTDPKTAT